MERVVRGTTRVAAENLLLYTRNPDDFRELDSLLEIVVVELTG